MFGAFRGQRQLRPEMHGSFGGKTVPQHVKHGPKCVISLMPPLEVKLFSKRLEPDVGLLNRMF